jgi:hypothetical protein
MTKFEILESPTGKLPPSTIVESTVEKSLKESNTLSLRYCKLSTFPDCLWNDAKITKLDLSENDLTSIPQNIEKLLNLKVLLLDSNKLGSIPKNLPNLEILSLNGNVLLKNCNFENLPSSVTELYLSSIGLKTIPSFISKLKNLKKLVLAKNQISGNLPLFSSPLRFINLCFNNLTLSMLDSLYSVSTLDVLLIHGNLLTPSDELFFLSKIRSVAKTVGLNYVSTLEEEYMQKILSKDEEWTSRFVPNINLVAAKDMKDLLFSHADRNVEILSPIESEFMIESISSENVSVPSSKGFKDFNNNNNNNNNNNTISNNEQSISATDSNNSNNLLTSSHINKPASENAVKDIINLIINETSDSSSIPPPPTAPLPPPDDILLLNVDCAKCKGTINQGEYLRALNNAWHIECFRCYNCTCKLEDHFYQLIDSGGVYCENCYRRIKGFICGKCDETILEEVSFVDFNLVY